MSVPVRYSANAMECDMNAESCDVEPAEGKVQWMISDEDRLGIPDAAGACNIQPQCAIAHMIFHSLSSEEIPLKLKEYDTLQDKYHALLFLPRESEREVTAGGRNGSAYVLRCLKVWYELPTDVLFVAMSLVDRFLDTLTVKPKHMACLSVASFHLALKQLGLNQIPLDDLVTISQCGCTPRDLERMANVIASKLGVNMEQETITGLTFVRIYYILFGKNAEEIGGAYYEFYKKFMKIEEIEMRLEILLCDAETTVVTPSTLALALFCIYLDSTIKESYPERGPELKAVFEYIIYMQELFKIPESVFCNGFSKALDALSPYNGQKKIPHKQRLVWRLSSRTMRLLRPTRNLTNHLPTIEEDRSNQIGDNISRPRTESSSSEDEEDWPTSPIIPIFEQCE